LPLAIFGACRDITLKKLCWLALLSTTLHLLTVVVRASDTPQQAAQRSAEAWLAAVDAAKYEEAWKQASSLLKSRVNRDELIRSLGDYRVPLGRVKSRTVKDIFVKDKLPREPKGEYLVLHYSSNFENKSHVIETVTLTRDSEGQWRVSGYYLK
jgi:hypothetical protein